MRCHRKFGGSRRTSPRDPCNSPEDQPMTNINELPYVEAELNYLAPMTERPRYYAYEPQPGEPHSNLTPEPHQMHIHSLRPIADELGLDVQGFALLEQRSAVPGQQDRSRSGPRQPATRVHVDHTARSGPQRVRDLMGDEAEELLKGRVQVINMWRPIRGPLRDAPLAVCDSRTVAAD